MDIIQSLFLLAAMMTGYNHPDQVPVIIAEPHQFFVDNTCNAVDTNIAPCYTVGLYVYDAKTIFIDVSLDNETAKGVLLHEFVHYLQDYNGRWNGTSCGEKILREIEAYSIENRYFRETGHPWLEVEVPPAERICGI